MNEVNVWFGLSTFLGGGVFAGVAAYFSVMRKQFTKEAHDEICDGKERLVALQLEQINKTLTKHTELLDRIIINGRDSQDWQKRQGAR